MRRNPQSARKPSAELHPRGRAVVATARRGRPARNYVPPRDPLLPQNTFLTVKSRTIVGPSGQPIIACYGVPYNIVIQPDRRNEPEIIDITESHSDLNAEDDLSMPEKVFSNRIVWRKVGDYLNFSDLKECRLVSKHFNRMVIDETKFKDRACVSPITVTGLLNDEGFGTTKELWKSVKIPIHPFCNGSECRYHNTDRLYPVLGEIEEATFFMGNPCRSTATPSFHPSLGRLLSNMPKLKRLAVDQQLLEGPLFSECAHELSKLVQFKIITQTGLPCYAQMVGLKHVIVRASLWREFEMSTEFYQTPCVRNVSLIVRILEESQDCLESLKVHDPGLWEPSSSPSGIHSPMRHKVFPALRCLRLCITSTNKTEVIKFLESQPPLEHIEVDLQKTKYDDQFPKELLSVIAEKSANLKILRISSWNFQNVVAADFEFLLETHLEELSLAPLDDEVLHLDQLVQFGGLFMQYIPRYLPKTVRKLRLQGNTGHQHPTCTGIYVSSFDSTDQSLLTHLSISRLAGAVNYITLNYIFAKLTWLRELHLSSLGDCVSDSHFTGQDWQDGEVGNFSISNLKGLRLVVVPDLGNNEEDNKFGHATDNQYRFCFIFHVGLRALTIRKCTTITDYTLTNAIKFQELRYLDLSYNPKVTTSGCQAVLQQNPSLEIFVNDQLHEFPTESERRIRFPRLKCFRKWTFDVDCPHSQIRPQP